MKKETTRTGVFRYTDLKRGPVKFAYCMMYVLMIAICIVMLAPIVWVFMSSIKSYEEFIQIPPTLIPHSFELKNIPIVWNEMKFYRYFINSLIVCGGCVLSTLMLSGMLGYVMSRIRPKGAKLVYTILFTTMLIPGTTNLIPLYMTYINFPLFGNLSNTYWPMWISAGASVYYTILFKQFFDAVPMAYIESAKIDGCGLFRTFLSIVLPLSKPIMLVIGVFTFNASWNDFLMPYLLLKKTERHTIGVALASAERLPGNQGIIAAMFAMVVPILVFCFMQRYIIDNMTMSGIKG